jgi:hypothetical protein
MRHLPMVFLSLLTMALARVAWADNPMAARSSPQPQPPPVIAGSSPMSGATAADQLRALLKHLDIDLIAKARAAECEEEGEICKTNADCCSGLECTGDPQPTCQPEE